MAVTYLYVQNSSLQLLYETWRLKSYFITLWPELFTLNGISHHNSLCLFMHGVFRNMLTFLSNIELDIIRIGKKLR